MVNKTLQPFGFLFAIHHSLTTIHEESSAFNPLGRQALSLYGYERFLSMSCAYIGIGSNKGKRIKNVREALDRIKKKMKIERISSLYLTEPIEVNPVREGFSNGVKGEWFINCALEVMTNKEPVQLLRTLLKIEEKMGRIRIKEKKISRIIDLDLLLYEEKILKEKELVLPHPSLHKRRFVLAPLNEINPDIYHPLLKKPVKELLASLTDNQAVERISSHQDVCS